MLIDSIRGFGPPFLLGGGGGEAGWCGRRETDATGVPGEEIVGAWNALGEKLRFLLKEAGAAAAGASGVREEWAAVGGVGWGDVGGEGGEG